MALSAIERLDLSDELDELLEKAGTAKGLDLLDLNDQIDDVLVKLGYGAADAPAPTPPPPADPKDDGAPEIVTKFLAGD
ncbi:ddrA, partial [Chimaeribacter californicus]